MRRILKETKQSDNSKKMEALYLKNITLARDAEQRGDQVLSESYYQTAEYYLYAMNEHEDSVSDPDIYPSMRKSHFTQSRATQRIIQNFSLNKTSHKGSQGKQIRLRQEGNMFSIRDSYLHRNRQ